MVNGYFTNYNIVSKKQLGTQSNGNASRLREHVAKLYNTIAYPELSMQNYHSTIERSRVKSCKMFNPDFTLFLSWPEFIYMEHRWCVTDLSYLIYNQNARTAANYWWII